MQHALRLLVLWPVAFALLAGCSEGRATPAPAQSTVLSEQAVQDVDALIVGGQPVQVEFQPTPGLKSLDEIPERLYWRTNGTHVRVDTWFRSTEAGGAYGYFTFHGDAIHRLSKSNRLCDWSVSSADAGVFYGGCTKGASGRPMTSAVASITHAAILRTLPRERFLGHPSSCFAVRALAMLDELKICIADDLRAPVFIGQGDGSGFIATRIDSLDTSSPLEPPLPVDGHYATHPIEQLLLPSGLPDW